MDKKLLDILLELLGQASSFDLLDSSGHEIDDLEILASQVIAAQETGALMKENLLKAIKLVKGNAEETPGRV
jgi:hypothetical protein